jgi:probable rRNA maturation factor
MELDFLCENDEFVCYEQIYENILGYIIENLQIKCNPIVSVSFVDNTAIHEINRTYRNIDRPTDVISFAFLDNVPNKEQLLKSNNPVCLGDIYISTEKAIEQAKDYGHSLKRELCFLFVHGILHLLGYDHINPEDEKIMFEKQDEILNNLGVTK